MSALAVEAIDPASVPVPPAYLFRRPRAYTLVDKVTRVLATVDRTLEPEQRLAVDVLTGYREGGVPSSLVSCVVCARQNLKTYVLEGIVLTRLLDHTDTATLYVWTAQQLRTVKETFLHFCELFEDRRYPHLRRRLAGISSGKGAEEIRVRDSTGRLKRLMFAARSDDAARGLTGDVIVLDEGYALAAGHLGAMVPTLSTKPLATIYVGSSAGHEDSEVLRDWRDAGRTGDRAAGVARPPSWVEWCAPGSLKDPGCTNDRCQHRPGTAGCVLDRHDYVLQANPLAGRRIGWDFLDEERASMRDPVEYSRERLGWWQDPLLLASPITAEAWAALKDADSAVQPGARPSLAFDVRPDQQAACIALAGQRADGAVHVGIIRQAAGVEWLVTELRKLQTLYRPRSIVADGASPAVVALLPKLKARGVRVTPLTATGVAGACGALLRATTEGGVRHKGGPEITDALDDAARQDVGDGGWKWARKKSSADISALVAATLAHSAATSTPQAYDVRKSFG